MARDCLIQDHGIIGNMQSAALVGLDGVIDFYCYPQFDSPSVFAALLDGEQGRALRASRRRWTWCAASRSTCP